MKIKQVFFSTLLLVFFANFSMAQKLSLENVQKITLNAIGAIRQAAEVKGYYFFYMSDKIDKKTNEYTLGIYDENLGKLKDIKFTDSKDISILECSFNGTDLIFLFYNEKEKLFTYQVYGADGKKKFDYQKEITNKEKNYLKTTYFAASDEDQTYKGLYPIEGQGFISNMPSREDRDYTFEINYYGTDKKKQWSYIPTEGYKRFVADYLGTYNGVVYIEVLKFKSLMDGNPDSFILGLSLENGKVLFEKTTDLPKNKFYPASLAVTNDGKMFVTGEYFNAKDNILKDKSLGFGFWGMDTKGNTSSEKYVNWEDGLGKYLHVTSKGKIDDFGYMFIHNIVQTADGQIFAVAEGMKKAASALGIASTMLGGGGRGASITKIKVTDMLIITFDKDFNVKAAKVYEKNSNSVELPGGSELMGTTILGKFLKYYWGCFDYNYTQVNSDMTSFSVCYSDYDRGKDYKGTTFNSISYKNGKFTTDKIQTKSDASASRVLPGKQGQVLIIEYYRKAKKVEMHVEKLN